MLSLHTLLLMDPLGDFLSINIPASAVRYKHMYVTKRKNDMNIRMGEFMLKGTFLYVETVGCMLITNICLYRVCL